MTQTAPNEFLVLDFNLPNHNVELNKAEIAFNKIKTKFDIYNEYNTLSDANHIIMYEDTIRVLDYVGSLSTYVFKIEDELERMYIRQHPHNPCLAKQLWQDHYEHINKPYTLMKNRCFKLLDDLDGLYMRLYKKDPPNIKP